MPHDRRIECPLESAEGKILGFPYDTQLVSIDGVTMHIWFGDTPITDELLAKVKTAANNQRDVVSFTYSTGEPTKFWANEDIT
jgi:hypothetical protein